MGKQPSSAGYKAQQFVESIIFLSRWLLAPLYIGLIVGLIALLIHFFLDLGHLLRVLITGNDHDTILGVLGLVDLTLVANLVLIVMFSGYESFVSRIDSDTTARPAWMGKINFSGLKIMLMASLAAISGLNLLEALLKISSQTSEILAWKVGILFAFVVSAVLLALVERLEKRAPEGRQTD
jgi:uncharacterized protein (TIGR00645 family)